MSNGNEKSSYADAGVDTEAGERAVDLMRSAIAKSTRSEVVGDFGGFAGLALLILVLKWGFSSNRKMIVTPIKAGKKDQYGLLRPLQTPSNYIEAQMSLQKLTDANIKATLTQTLDGPQLMVFEKDLKIAAAVLAQ